MFDEPDEEWTDEYAWTRYRGPQPYPVPADWVLNLPEEGGAMWYRYPGVGQGLQSDDDVYEVFEPDDEAYNDARGETAFLMPEVVDEDRRAREVTQKWELTIGGETVFERVDPDYEELWATAAAALATYAGGTDVADLDCVPSSGRLPEEERQQREVEKRENENQSLGDFA